jgi:serine/threonine-protein kinase
MAEVYLALSGELTGFRTLVVVKRILPHLASNSQFIRMFLDESRLAALLDHPNIIRIIEVGHDGEDYFLAMELVQGKPLSAVLRKAQRERRAPTPALAAFVLAQAAHGLAYAHSLTDGDGRPLGVVHRDVSPQNVLISFEGGIKLIDFGVARAFGRVAHTSPGGLKGKIDYMSPEQASAEDVDHRADVFALGVVLWEALTGKRLFRRETELATMRAIVDDPIPRPSEVAPVPEELEAIVMRALRKRRDARFPSAHEMAVALERYAFSIPGFTPMQVPSYMKDLFSAEFLQWRKTATAALDLAVEPADSGAAGDGLFNEPQTHGPTMALRGAPWLDPPRSEVRSAANVASRSRGSHSQPHPEPRSKSSSASSPRSGSAAAPKPKPSRRDRLWVYGGIGIVLSIAAVGAWVFARAPGARLDGGVAHSSRAGRPSAPPPPAAGVPTPAPTLPSAAAIQAASQVRSDVRADDPPLAASAAAGTPAPIPAATSSATSPASAEAWQALSRAAQAPPRPHPHRKRVARHGDEGSGEKAADKPDAPPPSVKKADPFAD